MLKLATILDNPGEPPAETRYRDPEELRRLGYDGLVIYSTTGLSGLLGHDTIANADIRRWVADQFERAVRRGAPLVEVKVGPARGALQRQALELAFLEEPERQDLRSRSADRAASAPARPSLEASPGADAATGLLQ